MLHGAHLAVLDSDSRCRIFLCLEFQEDTKRKSGDYRYGKYLFTKILRSPISILASDVSFTTEFHFENLTEVVEENEVSVTEIEHIIEMTEYKETFSDDTTTQGKESTAFPTNVTPPSVMMSLLTTTSSSSGPESLTTTSTTDNWREDDDMVSSDKWRNKIVGDRWRGRCLTKRGMRCQFPFTFNSVNHTRYMVSLS